eukprot:m.125377 g.125377  ORF g.125377 m.125377 type:complete len:564 (-) comp29128_c0_seq1:1411-3102(-)
MATSNFTFLLNESCSLVDVPEELLCEYVSTVVDCLTTSRIPYLELPYCDLKEVSGLAVVILVLWLFFLFLNLSLVVDARVVPNIKTTAKALHLSDTLAGVTLLAFGNGAADIFSAVASVSASPDGGLMMVAGLIGGGLFVTTVVAGIIAYKFVPEVNWKFIARDASFYLIGLGVVAYILADGWIKVWETIMLLVLYVMYVAIVVIQERCSAENYVLDAKDDENDVGAKSSERTPLLATTTKSNPEFQPPDNVITHPSVLYDPYDPTMREFKNPKNGPGTLKMTLSKFDLLGEESSPWKSKNVIIKIITLLQAPVKCIVVAACPVVYLEDRLRSWDRNLFTFICFISPPLVVMILEEDAFYWETLDVDEIVFPWLLLGTAIGVCASMVVWFSTSVDYPPKYNSVFAAWGFLIALVFIYCISDEIVSVLRSFGIMLGIPTSVVGMTVLGIGNGMCDLIANYLCAANGLATVAITAVYAGPALNLFVGLSIAGLIGTSKYGGDYAVPADLQMKIGMCFIGVGLFTGIAFSTVGILSKRHGKGFFLLYGLFLIATVIAVVLMANGTA